MRILIDGDNIDYLGHMWICSSGHVKCSIGNQLDAFVHRRIVEKVLQRPLLSTEHVHHIDYNKLNNRRTNLLVCSNSYHRYIHAAQDSINDGYDPRYYGYCSDCQEYHLREEFPKSKNRWNGLHNICKLKQNARRRGNVKLLERRRELRRERRLDL